MIVFTENARARLVVAAFSVTAARFDPRINRAVLHEGRMYTRNVKACRSTEERTSLDRFSTNFRRCRVNARWSYESGSLDNSCSS